MHKGIRCNRCYAQALDSAASVLRVTLTARIGQPNVLGVTLRPWIRRLVYYVLH